MSFGKIPQSFIQDIVSRTDIVDIVQSRLSLIKRGDNYVTRCPFHQEKTPSFTVSLSKQFYYCFGCRAHGNVISFLMAYDRLEFIDVIEYLASQLGLEVPHQHEQQQTIPPELYEFMESVAKYYQKQLRAAPQAINYLKSRGLTGQIAKEFLIGYAPTEWNNLLNDLHFNQKDRGYLVSNGLLIEKDNNRHYDRFRNRIIFPIRDLRGRVIAFGGRTISGEEPKYLNSPETPIFHKSNELYGLYEARKKNHKLKNILIVEGYMDVISLAQHGITYAVATLGTAINRTHLLKLLRYSSNLIFCFDGDLAGQNAAWKALTIALSLLRDGVHLQFLFLPEKEDPDSFIRKIGAKEFEHHLQCAHSIDEILFTKLQQEIPIHSPEGKAHFAKVASQLLNTMPQGLYRSLLYKQLAQLLDISITDLEKLQESTAKSHYRKEKHSIYDTHISTILSPAKLAIAILLQKPQLATNVNDLAVLEQCQTPERNLFIQLVRLLQQEPSVSTGHLLTHWTQPTDQCMIAELAALPLTIPEEGIRDEFLGTLDRLKEQSWDHMARKLIDKGKHQNLTKNEKEQLNAILKKKACKNQ